MTERKQLNQKKDSATISPNKENSANPKSDLLGSEKKEIIVSKELPEQSKPNSEAGKQNAGLGKDEPLIIDDIPEFIKPANLGETNALDSAKELIAKQGGKKIEINTEVKNSSPGKYSAETKTTNDYKKLEDIKLEVIHPSVPISRVNKIEKSMSYNDKNIGLRNNPYQNIDYSDKTSLIHNDRAYDLAFNINSQQVRTFVSPQSEFGYATDSNTRSKPLYKYSNMHESTTPKIKSNHKLHSLGSGSTGSYANMKNMNFKDTDNYAKAVRKFDGKYGERAREANAISRQIQSRIKRMETLYNELKNPNTNMDFLKNKLIHELEDVKTDLTTANTSITHYISDRAGMKDQYCIADSKKGYLKGVINSLQNELNTYHLIITIDVAMNITN